MEHLLGWNSYSDFQIFILMLSTKNDNIILVNVIKRGKAYV